MTLLVLFAFLAGAGTAVSPCVLPVLPALLSAGSTGGRRRPLGIVSGLALTFTITIVGLASVVDGVGLGSDGTRALAIVVLAVFAIVTLVPALGDRLAVPLSRLARFGPKDRGDGFWSGVAVGGALGFLYAPCAGPILAAVITVGSASGDVIAVAVAYAAGSAVVLLAIALGGRALSDRIRAAGRGPALQRALGVVMLLTAVAMAADLDVRFQNTIADKLPAGVVNPTRSLEASARVRKELDSLRGPSKFDDDVAQAAPRARGAETGAGGVRSSLPDLGTAPDFTGNQRWWGTPGGRPLTLAGLRGRVVLVDFWTYTCINCIRTLPALRAWHERYARAGLTIVGVHSPEFGFEKDAGNVSAAIRRNRLRYAVAQDNDLATWNAWGNQYWPAKYLVDADGQVRYTHFGEGDYDKTEAAIRSLLRERGDTALTRRDGDPVTARPARRASPETYLGTDRATGYLPGNEPQAGTHRYPAASAPPLNAFALSGTWTTDGEHATAGAGARIRATVQGKDVYLVLSPPPGDAGDVQVRVGGRPVSAALAGADVRDGRVRVTRQRLYHLVHAASVRRHELELRVGPGVSGYAFTFG